MSAPPRPGADVTSVTTPVATASNTATVPAMAPETNRRDRRAPNAAPVAVTAIVDGPGVPITAMASSSSVSKDGQGSEAKNICPVMADPVT